jgi:hypothetical protein
LTLRHVQLTTPLLHRAPRASRSSISRTSLSRPLPQSHQLNPLCPQFSLQWSRSVLAATQPRGDPSLQSTSSPLWSLAQ